MIFKKNPSARFQSNSSFHIEIHHNFPISNFHVPISRNWMMSFYQQYLQFYKRFTYIKVKRFFPSPVRNTLGEKFLCSVAQLGRKFSTLEKNVFLEADVYWIVFTSWCFLLFWVCMCCFGLIYTVKLERAKFPANAGNFTCSSQVKRSLAQFTCFEPASSSRRAHANCLRAHVNLPEDHRHFTGIFTSETHANLPATSMQNCLLLQAKIHATYRQKH